MDDGDLLLQPAPSSVLQVNLQGHNLILIPEGLVGATDQRPGGQGDCPEDPELGAFLRPLGENMVVEQGFFCECMPEIVRKIEAFEEQWMDPPAGPRGPTHISLLGPPPLVQ